MTHDQILQNLNEVFCDIFDDEDIFEEEFEDLEEETKDPEEEDDTEIETAAT